MEEQPVINNQVQQAPVNPVPVSKKPNYWIVAIIVFVLLLVIGSIYMFSLRSQKQMFPPPPEPPLPPKITLQPSPGQDPTANWKTYANTKYGYSIKYPQELNIYTRVESLPGNEEQRKLHTTCCIGIYNKDSIILGVDAFEEKRTLEQYKNELLAKDPKDVSNLRTIKILDKEALEYNFTSNKIVTLIDNNTRYNFLYIKGDHYLADQILSTFKFLDQENQVACTLDAKLCPDGSYVSRQPPNCEFAACP